MKLKSKINKYALMMFSGISLLKINHSLSSYDLSELPVNDIFDVYQENHLNFKDYSNHLDKLADNYNKRLYSDNISLNTVKSLLLNFSHSDILFSTLDFEKISEQLELCPENEYHDLSVKILDICFHKRLVVIAWNNVLSQLYDLFGERCSKINGSNEIFRTVSEALYLLKNQLDHKLKNEFVQVSDLLEKHLSYYMINIDDILDMNVDEISNRNNDLFLEHVSERPDSDSLETLMCNVLDINELTVLQNILHQYVPYSSHDIVRNENEIDDYLEHYGNHDSLLQSAYELDQIISTAMQFRTMAENNNSEQQS